MYILLALIEKIGVIPEGYARIVSWCRDVFEFVD